MVGRESIDKLKERLIKGIKTNPGKRDYDCLVREVVMYFASQGIQIKRESAEEYIPLIEDLTEVREGFYYTKSS